MIAKKEDDKKKEVGRITHIKVLYKGRHGNGEIPAVIRET